MAARFIAANDHPDHDTIDAFRRRLLKEIEALFVQVLLLAREATPEGRQAHALRKQTPEPVFGIIKAVMGSRQFSLRGIDRDYR